MVAQDEAVVGASPNCFLGFDPYIAYRHFQRAGLHHVEVPASPGGLGGFAPATMSDDDVRGLVAWLRERELHAISVGAYCDMLDPHHQRLLPRRIDFARELGASSVVTDATRQLELDADGWRRLVNALWSAGDYATDRGVGLALETHGGITRNGALARRLLDAVDHPAVGVNYDTGNIHYYNEGLDTVEDLRQVADRVIQVHLKDTDGGVGDWSFCALGDGRVDFPRVIGVLQEVGFKGPYSLEIEGRQGEDLNLAQHFERVERSLDYLGRIGLMATR